MPPDILGLNFKTVDSRSECAIVVVNIQNMKVVDRIELNE